MSAIPAKMLKSDRNSPGGLASLERYG